MPGYPAGSNAGPSRLTCRDGYRLPSRPLYRARVDSLMRTHAQDRVFGWLPTGCSHGNADNQRLPCRGCTRQCANYARCNGKPWNLHNTGTGHRSTPGSCSGKPATANQGGTIPRCLHRSADAPWTSLTIVRTVKYNICTTFNGVPHDRFRQQITGTAR